MWSASFRLNPEPHRAAYRAALAGEPVARSSFDLYLTDGALIYVKEPCEQADTEARFFLHIVPQSADDLPEGRREYGFNGLDFDFFSHGALFAGGCGARSAAGLPRSERSDRAAHQRRKGTLGCGVRGWRWSALTPEAPVGSRFRGQGGGAVGIDGDGARCAPSWRFAPTGFPPTRE